MRRFFTLGALVFSGALLCGCPVYPSESCFSNDDCPNGYVCDDRDHGGRCVQTPSASSGTPTTNHPDDTGRCLSPSDCSYNETCGPSGLCLPGDCSNWGCVSGYKCDLSRGVAVCVPQSSSGAGGTSSGTGGKAGAGASGQAGRGGSAGGEGGAPQGGSAGNASAGNTSQGGASQGGEGGASQGGQAQGGEAQGGQAQAGSAQGGEAQGGQAQAGSAQGGEAQGGQAQGGALQGGAGGEAQGGSAQAGSAQGGAAQAGAGGDTGQGGSAGQAQGGSAGEAQGGAAQAGASQGGAAQGGAAGEAQGGGAQGGSAGTTGATCDSGGLPAGAGNLQLIDGATWSVCVGGLSSKPDVEQLLIAGGTGAPTETFSFSVVGQTFSSGQVSCNDGTVNCTFYGQHIDGGVTTRYNATTKPFTVQVTTWTPTSFIGIAQNVQAQRTVIDGTGVTQEIVEGVTLVFVTSTK